ncbi:preprotein translocase subunit SecG [Chthonobacter albigriseus]|uniref:preprotein translocase subunit SecG n=1 Tax=Chthonobacter albigriseus TaxID=1683161 RepID=UPI0015EF5116|nr:preprotein translocase subunit SecG [Chthonobacter albigriseus]
METVLLVVHLMVVVALVGVVLLQRSEGGALGIGGGGGFMSSRGTANVLTRTTAILAAVFFVTSLALSILPRFIGGPGSIFDSVPGAAPAQTGTDAPVGGGAGGVLDDLNRLRQPPGAQVPEAPAPGAQIPAPAEPAAPAAPAAETVPAPAAPAAETAPAAPATDSAPAAPAAPAPAAPAAPAPAQ